MDSSTFTTSSSENELSAENGGDIKTPFSPNSPTGSENGGLLDKDKKKVGQLGASGCENPQGAYFMCKHGHPIYRTLSCHARFEVDCPHCARNWRRKAIKNLKKRVSVMLFPALVTLTLKKPSVHSLEELNKLVHRCRKYLRRRGYEIRACVSCLEPPNHLHAVWDCSYIPQRRLSKVWHTITGDSIIVDIRKVDKHRWRGAVNYLARYITQISDMGSSLDFYGVHVVTSWGDGGYYKKIRMACKICGSYFELLFYCGQVDDIDNDDVDFVEIDPG